jgi:hypothetical protein
VIDIAWGALSVCYVGASLYWLWSDHRNPESWENENDE